jgi:hypothetical protein
MTRYKLGVIDSDYKIETDLINEFRKDLAYKDSDGISKVPSTPYTGTEQSDYLRGAYINKVRNMHQNRIWTERNNRLNKMDKWISDNYEPTPPDTHYTFNPDNMHNWFTKTENSNPNLHKVKQVKSGSLHYNIYNIRPKATYELSANGSRRLYESEARSRMEIYDKRNKGAMELINKYVKQRYN